ncbi:Prestin [Halotydeus destructor]|nr:Prestin [Halotydeus destructor]
MSEDGNSQLRSRNMAVTSQGQRTSVLELDEISSGTSRSSKNVAFSASAGANSRTNMATLDLEKDAAEPVRRPSGEVNGGPSGSPPRTPSPGSSSLKHKVTLERDAIEWSDLLSKFGKQYIGRRDTLSSRIAESAEKSIHDFRPLVWLLNLFPILSWMRTYNVKNCLVADVVMGFTVAVLHIPQGMAYGLLAGVSPINGLYVSFFPVLVYFFMGTSKHISIGTFAVVSIMLRSSLTKLGSFQNLGHHETQAAGMVTSVNLDEVVAHQGLSWPPTPEEGLTSMCLVTGIIMVLMGFLHLGSLSLILSDQLVSAFSCGSAVHVATSQFSNLIGFAVTSPQDGPFKLVYTWTNLFQRVFFETKLPTLAVSLTAMGVLVLFKDVLEPRLQRQLKFSTPLPVDLMVIIAATAISYGMGLFANYNVAVMGEIPTGLPAPQVPRLDYVGKILPDCIALAIVSFAISLSLAKIYAKTHKYKVTPNQELLAIGTANIVSSFFACYPCAASLSRSSVQERGGKTHVTSLVSCALILVVLLFLGPLLYHLPKCILSSVILVALKGMFLQVRDFKKSWRLSRFEALTWLVTFLGVVLFDVDVGLLVGILFSIFVVMIRFIIPSSTILGQLPYTEIYVDIVHFNAAHEITGIKIFQYNCSLFFMNRDHFRNSLFQRCLSISADDLTDMSNANKEALKSNRGVHTVILDCSTISYIDTAGVETVAEIVSILKELDIRCFLASCPTQILTMFERTRVMDNLCSNYSGVFPSVHDAVVHCYPMINVKHVPWNGNNNLTS